MTEVVRRRARISGRVQGVWFRGATREQAMRHGLGGSVRNLPGGDVEAVFEGPQDAVDALLAFVRQGPPHARVESVHVDEEPPEGETDFQVVY